MTASDENTNPRRKRLYLLLPHHRRHFANNTKLLNFHRITSIVYPSNIVQPPVQGATLTSSSSSRLRLLWDRARGGQIRQPELPNLCVQVAGKSSIRGLTKRASYTYGTLQKWSATTAPVYSRAEHPRSAIYTPSPDTSRVKV